MRTFDPSVWQRTAPTLFSKLESAAIDTNAWPDALNAICEAFNCTLFALRTIGEDAPPTVIASDGGAALTEVYIRDEWWKRDPRAAAFASAPILTLVQDSDLVSDAEIARHDFYRDFAFTHDISHLIGWRFSDGDTDLAFAFNRSASIGSATQEEVRALNEMMGHATATALLARKVSDARNQFVFEALINTKAAACLVDSCGRVLSVTPELESLLGKATWKRHAPISFADTKPTGAFETMLRALKSSLDDITGVRTFIATMPGGPRLIALPLILRGVGRDVLGGAKALIIFRSIDSAVRIDPVLIMEMFGLTSSEADVAIMIAQGKTVAEASVLRGVTTDTIRAMLKSAFHKTGTRGQAELVTLLLRSTIAIAN